jgi:site-specific DNA-methyltransferase (adenine-specific)
MKLKLKLGDCLEVLKTMPDNYVDLVLTDPPYGTTACKWDIVIPFAPMWEQIWRVLKPNGACILFGSEPFSTLLRASQINYFKYDIIWVKNKASNVALANKQPMRHHEIISLFYREQPTYNPQKEIAPKASDRHKYKMSLNRGDSINTMSGIKYSETYEPDKLLPKSVIEVAKDSFGKSVFHPTQKPVALLEYLVKTYTNEGEMVLDFTMGSGSTGVACVNTNRNFIGIEKDEKYFQTSKQRIEEAQNVKKENS